MADSSPPTPAAQADRRLDDRRKHEARYLHLLNCDLFGVGIGDFSGNIHDANQSFLNTFGYTRDDLERGLRWTDMTHSDYRSLDEIVLREARAKGVSGPYEKEMIRRDGARVPVLVHLAVAPDDSQCLVASVIDLTRQKQAEAALRLSEARFRLLVEGTSEYAFYMLDPTGRVATWSTSCETIMGYRADEAIGQPVSVFFFPEDIDAGKPQSELDQAERGRAEGEGWRLRKDGSRFWAHVTTIALREGPGELLGFARIVRDLTDRRRSEALLSSTLDNVIDGVIGISAQGSIESFNAAAQRMFGYGEAEVIGRPFGLLLREAHRAEAIVALERCLHGGPSSARGPSPLAQGRRKDGGEFPMEFAASEFVLYDQRHFTGVVRDITEKRHLEEQLRQAQKMEAIGQLAGGVAHDFNNLLTVILGYGEILLDGLDADDPMCAPINAICESGIRAAGLTRQLLAFSRRSVLEPKLIDINALLLETEKMLRRLIGEDIVLSTVLAEHLDRVMVDPGQIDQVLMNLAVNARDAMPQGGLLTIETSSVEIDEEYVRLHPEVHAGRYVKLTMTDTGCGIPPEIKAHIFEPFFTTKDKGKGTGLGLATVYGIIKQSGGHIDVYSELEYGTTFKILLPVAEQPAAAAGDHADTDAVRHGHETILVVEDEAGVRSMVVHALQRLGYDVLQAASGFDALELGRDDRWHVDLLLTDVVMPEMNGRQLAEILQMRFPELKVMFMSGYTDDAVIRHGILQAEVTYLQKPFSPAVLTRKVREVLDHEAHAVPRLDAASESVADGWP